MAEPVRIVIDAMGGDNAPSEPVRAAVEAVSERKDIKIFLTGLPQVLEQELKK
ncbi:MAG: phosphate acyltransferase, partial [Blautia sp.]|nr:phosphate acyltransferase [Blautia sp.]